MKLEQIGFYTLSDRRAASASETSNLSRCELILTGRCNFRCPYCRRVGGSDIEFEQAAGIVRQWALDGLYAIRFSGGEPLLYPKLRELVGLARAYGIQKIAVSSNGSLPFSKYEELVEAGVNDWSISLDACCAEDCNKMSGVKGAWNTITNNIRELVKKSYVTVGIVLTNDNVDKINDIIRFAASLGVGDIRVIPAAQDGDRLADVKVDANILEKYPILRYRIDNLQAGRPVRGLGSSDSNRCGLVLDDMAVCGDKHYPCIIYLREGGREIGSVGPNMRQERKEWFDIHDTHVDPICSKNCLDVCVEYNNTFREFRERKKVVCY
jgi:MoaA/NifB/PqqE/SkfB family radical SAM enzyme